jgi:hypothetical protein
MRNGVFMFSPAGRRLILNCFSPKDKNVQEAMCFLLTMIFDSSFSKNYHGWLFDQGCQTYLNQIKLQFAVIYI